MTSDKRVAVFDSRMNDTCYRNYDEGARCGRPKGHEGACSQVSRWASIDEVAAMHTKKDFWIFSLSAPGQRGGVTRRTVVGPACAATVEAVLDLASLPEDLRVELRASPVVQDFIEGKLVAGRIYRRHPSGPPTRAWSLVIETAHVVLGPWCPTCDGPHDDDRHREVRRHEGQS